MHRTAKNRPPNKQDIWLNGTNKQTRAALSLLPLAAYYHHPEDPAKQVALPL